MANNNSSTNGGASNRNSRRGGRGGRGGRSTRGGRNNDNNNPSNNYDKNKSTFKGQLQSGALKGIVITENANLRPIQYRELKKAVPIYCAEQDYTHLDEINLRVRILDLAVV